MGSRQFNSFGAHGASDHVSMAHYATLEECCQDLRTSKGGWWRGVGVCPARSGPLNLGAEGCRGRVAGSFSRPHHLLPAPRPSWLPAAPHAAPLLRTSAAAGCQVVGVEIIDGALPVHAFPFAGSTAFMLGNEVRGEEDL